MDDSHRLLLERRTTHKRQERSTEGIDQSCSFIIIKDTLYRRGHSLPYLHCANKEEINYVLREVHEGICGNHAEARSLAGKTLRVGYYWPTLQKDAYDIVKACD